MCAGYVSLNGMIIMSLALSLSGCATMSESECLQANWETIGFEDGERGRLISYLGTRRKACAEYQVAPNLNTYQLGHQRGVEVYCKESRGFQLGRNGNEYNGVCPKHLELEFLTGFENGKLLYRAEAAVYQIEQQIAQIDSEIDELNVQLNVTEEQLVHAASSEERRHLVGEVRGFSEDLAARQAQMRHFLQELGAAERDLQNIKHSLRMP